MSYKDQGVIGEISGIGQLLSHGAETNELVLDRSRSDGLFNMLHWFADAHHYPNANGACINIETRKMGGNKPGLSFLLRNVSMRFPPLTFARQSQSLLQIVESCHRLLGGTLAKEIPSQEPRKVLDRPVDFIATHSCGRKPEPRLDVDDG